MKDDVRTFSYTDYVSRFMLWQKAFTLLPLWGFPTVLVVGGIFSLFGSFGVELGYVLTMGSFVAYLVEDLLKTKMRVDNGYLFHGFRVFNLSLLAAMSLEYKQEQMVPGKIVLNFANGKRYKLRLSRLKQSDTEWLLKYIETRYPTAKIDPVLRTLSKCKRVAATTALETKDKVEIPYQSRILLKQLKETFVKTSDMWLRAGPALMCLLVTGFWLQLFSHTFAMLSLEGDWQTVEKMATKKSIEKIYEDTMRDVADVAGKAGNHLVDFLANPATVGAMLLLLGLMLLYVIRYFMRPTALMLDANGLTQSLRFGNLNFTLKSTQWASLTNAYLKTASRKADLDRASIVFQDAESKPSLKLNLSSLQPDHRIRLLKAIEHFAPNLSIDAQASEALMPKQEKSYTELWLQSLSAAPERKSLEPLTPGQLIQDGRFEVARRLGIGGQGQAYLCTDKTDSSQPFDVVLKETILPLYVETVIRQQALERFQQEAELLKQLDSDRIVRLRDYFIEDHRGYLVLEHIDGTTLRSLIDEQGAMPEAQVRELALQMSETLAYLHERGIIHRDFTPDNLILKRSGKLTLIDFNVAQTAAAGSTGTIVGKHAYVPPEQFRGKPSFESDIYSMGATLTFLITGKDPEPISESRPIDSGIEISRALSDIIAQCTKLQVDKRIATATEAKEKFLALFEEHNNGDGVTISLKTKEHSTT